MKISVRQRWTWNGWLYWRVLSYNRYKGQSDHSPEVQRRPGRVAADPSSFFQNAKNDYIEYQIFATQNVCFLLQLVDIRKYFARLVTCIYLNVVGTETEGLFCVTTKAILSY